MYFYLVIGSFINAQYPFSFSLQFVHLDFVLATNLTSASPDKKSPTYMIEPLNHKKVSKRSGRSQFSAKSIWSDSGVMWMIWSCPQLKIHFERFGFFLFFFVVFFCTVVIQKRETFVFCCHCYFWPNSAVRRFMAVACTHSYSFVSIETLSPGQACFFRVT